MKQIIFLAALLLAALTNVWAQNNSLPNVDTIMATETVIPMQFGFVHPLGTNGLNSTKVYNKVSINALTGHSKGTLGTEISGIYSINKEHAVGFKASGVMDLVHGSVLGTQVGGVMASAGGATKGFQAGGVVALNGGNLHGMQAGGVFASNKSNVEGFQAGGVVAIIDGDSVRGMQAAGVVAINEGSIEGMQAAGVVGICRGNVEGVQAAGVVSQARFVKEAQIGIVNIADSVDDKSVQLGLVNISRKGGIMRFGVMTTEFYNATAFLKSGTRHFHGYVGMATQLHEKDYRFGPMIGVGTSIRLANRLYVEPEWMQWFVIHKNNLVYKNRSTQIQQLRTMFSFSTGKKGPHISAGPTINLSYTSYKNNNGETGIDFAPSYFYNKTFTRNQVNVRAWFGYNVTVSLGK